MCMQVRSTLLRLLIWFFDVNLGLIKIDGKDIRIVSLLSLRKQVAVVPQETANLRYGRLDATQVCWTGNASWADGKTRSLCSVMETGSVRRLQKIRASVVDSAMEWSVRLSIMWIGLRWNSVDRIRLCGDQPSMHYLNSLNHPTTPC